MIEFTLLVERKLRQYRICLGLSIAFNLFLLVVIGGML